MNQKRQLEERTTEMKNNKRKSKLIILFIVLGLTICGCISNGGVKTEKQIIGDINNSEYLSKYDLEVDEIKISRRKTDKINKTDSMVAWVHSENDIMEYTMEFELGYTLYNEGWLLDSISPICEDKWEYYPFDIATEEEADQVIEERYPSAKSYRCIEAVRGQEVHEDKSKTNVTNFTYEIIEEYPYLTQELDYKLIFEFSPDKNWQARPKKDNYGAEKSVMEDWRIDGIWTCTTDEEYGLNNATITINSYDGTTVDCSYEINHHAGDSYQNFKNIGTFNVDEYYMTIDTYIVGRKGIYIIGDIDSNGKELDWRPVGPPKFYFIFDKERGVILNYGDDYIMAKK